MSIIAVGTHADIGAAVDHAVRFDKTIDPVSETSAVYDRRYGLYAGLYRALAPLHHELG